MSNKARNFFKPEQVADIKLAIKNAELDTSGEIKVHLETKCEGDVLTRAAQVFEVLNMHETELHNGILIYLAVMNRKFAIIGDSGINAVVEPLYWERIKSRMTEHFRENRFAEGLVQAITETGQTLKSHFPRQTDDDNELTDDLSFGDE